MERHVWGTSACGCFEIISLTSDRLDEAFNLFQSYFIPYEPICKAVGLDKEPASQKELLELCYVIAKEGVSLIVLEKKTDRIVGLTFNKIWLNNEHGFFKQNTAFWKNRASKLFARFMMLGEECIDCFKYSKSKCIFEIMLGAVHPDFSGKKLGSLTILGSLKLADALNKGNNVRISLDHQNLKLQSPDIVTIFSTSLKPRKYIIDCNFFEVERIAYTNFIMEGNKTLDKMTTEKYAIQYISLSSEYVEDFLNLIRDLFFVDENVSKAVELHKNPAARKELDALSLRVAKDGLSIIAVEKATNKVVGVACNKLQVLESDQTSYFEKYLATCKEASSKALMQFMIDTDALVNLFEFCNVKCLLEIMFLAILPEFRCQHIGTKLCLASIEAAKLVKSGVNCKISITGEELSLELKPEVVAATFTSFITKKMAKKLGFITVADISYEKFVFQGKTFLERLGSDKDKSTTMDYIRL